MQVQCNYVRRETSILLSFISRLVIEGVPKTTSHLTKPAGSLELRNNNNNKYTLIKRLSKD
jgi:hypothetical protein